MRPCHRSFIVAVRRKMNKRAATLGRDKPQNPLFLLTAEESIELARLGIRPQELFHPATAFEVLRRRVRQIDTRLSLLQQEVLKHG